MNRWRSTTAIACGWGFSLDLIESRPGIAILAIEGKKAAEAFKNEPGGHRFQRVPATERHGRVHTSTVTVVVLREPTEVELRIEDKELEWKTCRGSGAGGQHRNVTDSAVIVKHLPTGVTVRCESERSQHQNKATALALLRARLLASKEAEASGAVREDRRKQHGSAMRGDKVRTIAIQRDDVIDHRTGKRISARDYLRGHLDLLA